MFRTEYDMDAVNNTVGIVYYIATIHAPFIYVYTYISNGDICYTRFGSMDVGYYITPNDKIYIENELLNMSYGHKKTYTTTSYKQSNWWTDQDSDEIYSRYYSEYTPKTSSPATTTVPTKTDSTSLALVKSDSVIRGECLQCHREIILENIEDKTCFCSQVCADKFNNNLPWGDNNETKEEIQEKEKIEV